MKKKNIIKIENYFETFLLLFFIILFLFVIKQFLLPLLLASSMVFLSYKFYNWILSKIKRKGVSAAIVVIIVLLFIGTFSYWLASTLVTETGQLMDTSENLLEEVQFSSCEFDFCRSLEVYINYIDLSFESMLLRANTYFDKSVSSLFDSILEFFTALLVFILAFFFLLKDGDKFVLYIKRLIPMKSQYKSALFIRFRDVTRAVFINTIFVAIIQGTLVGFALWIFGFTSPVFWAVVASFLALLPFLGAGLVWVPAVIYLFMTNNFYSGVILLIYGIFIVSFADNIIRPFLLNKKLEVHPFLILISILGGINVFGFLSGIFLGPIIISLLVSVLHLYNLNFDEY